MSNDFLRSYTIPTVQKSEAVTEKPEDDCDQPKLEATPAISNYSRYLPPGKQGDESRQNPRKRPQNELPSTENSEARIPIFTGRDRSYPDELNLLINPLFCELCKVQLNSQKTAACHYESKQHDRKITAWLAERYPNNPPPVKRFLKEGPTGPAAFRCETCDLPLTSLAHAKQHYAGRKHRLVASKISDPSGAGYYDSEGKWIRTGTKKFSSKNGDIRFGIGEDFVSQAASESTEKETNSAAVSPNPTAAVNESLCCKICDIVVTSNSQMDMHLNGAKHKKKVTASEAVVVQPANNGDNPNSILATINSDANCSEDLSMYRTPSGSYYCQVCNTTMNHVTVLQQHIQGRKHKNKAKSNPGKAEFSPAQ